MAYKGRGPRREKDVVKISPLKIDEDPENLGGGGRDQRGGTPQGLVKIHDGATARKRRR